MAAVLSLEGFVFNKSGSPLSGLTVTLKNASSGTTITTTTTDANGRWAFANQDETLAYRVEVAYGSGQVLVRRSWSGEAGDLYVRSSLRTPAAAVVAVGGAAAVGGVLTASGGIVTGTGTNQAVEVSSSATGNPFSRLFASATEAGINNDAAASGNALPFSVKVGGAERLRLSTTTLLHQGTKLELAWPNAGALNELNLKNTSGGASANGARLLLTADGEANTGDVFTRLVRKNGGASERNVVYGLDNDDGGHFKIEHGSLLGGSTSYLRYDTDGALRVVIGGTAAFSVDTAALAKFNADIQFGGTLRTDGALSASSVSNLAKVLTVKLTNGTILGYIPIYVTAT